MLEHGVLYASACKVVYPAYKSIHRDLHLTFDLRMWSIHLHNASLMLKFGECLSNTSGENIVSDHTTLGEGIKSVYPREK